MIKLIKTDDCDCEGHLRSNLNCTLFKFKSFIDIDKHMASFLSSLQLAMSTDNSNYTLLMAKCLKINKLTIVYCMHD